MTGHRALEDSDMALIERVKMTPSLYDPRNLDFRLAYRKEQEWEVVGAMIGMTATEARRRWTCLRDRYSRELKQLRLHPEKNEYGNSPFFRQMDFLRKFVRKRRNRRRNGYVEYEYQSTEEQKVNKDGPNLHKNDEEEDYSLENYDEQSETYDGKIDENTMESDYPEFVDVDAGEDVYEECVETPITETNAKQHTLNHTSIEVNSKQMIAPITSTAALPHNTNRAIHTLSKNQLQQQMVIKTSPAIASQATQYKQTRNLYANPQARPQQPNFQNQLDTNVYSNVTVPETEDDLFGKSIAVYLKQLSRRHKIKAQVEMFQILEKYIELEESEKVRISVKAANINNG
ncbi:uncharacterized protein LOC105225080 isoform X1 [Bactrocera dorsalis]|uniref:Transcription factor Adf-1 n=1 Tax=Bactrocera dorsalis TaxID=27457 RepID=A0A034WRP6_BACDO|nr:uncharacterized protein LOC105225080 isoform X1 [Bactrocera dorsalis]